MVSHFHEKRFPRNRRDVITIVPIQDCEGSALFINFFELVYFERFADFPFVNVWWNAYCFRMESVELSMAFFCMFCSPRWSPFSTHATCWCSMHRVKTLFFESPIYLLLHEQSNWHTPGWLFGSRLGLFFWQRICCRFFPDVKAISFLIFFNSRFTFGLMFGIQGNFFRFL